MGRTSRMIELLAKMAQKGGMPAVPTVAQVQKALQSYEDKIHELEDRIAELEKKQKGGKPDGH